MDTTQKEPPITAVMNVKEAARYIGVATATMNRWVHLGAIPHAKVGRLTKFRQADLDAWLAKRVRGAESIDQSDVK